MFFKNFGYTGSCFCSWAFSSCDECRLLSSCDAGASHSGGISCCNRLWGTQAQSSQCGDSVFVAHGLSCPSACEIFPDQRFESVSPALAGWVPTAGPHGKSPGKLLSVGNYVSQGSPGSSAGKESACNAGFWVRFLGLEDPLEKGQATHSSIRGLPWWLRW